MDPHHMYFVPRTLCWIQEPPGCSSAFSLAFGPTRTQRLAAITSHTSWLQPSQEQLVNPQSLIHCNVIIVQFYIGWKFPTSIHGEAIERQRQTANILVSTKL